jgi:alcohol dehydrogenase class IV
MGVPAEEASPEEVRTALLAELHELREAVGIGGGLGERGVERSLIPELTQNALQDPCLLTNPRRPFEADIEALYVEAL